MKIRLLLLLIQMLIVFQAAGNELFGQHDWGTSPNYYYDKLFLGQPGQFESEASFSHPSPLMRTKRDTDQLTSQCDGLRSHLSSLSNLLRDDILEALTKRNEEIKGFEDKVKVLRSQVSALRKDIELKNDVVEAQSRQIQQLQKALAEATMSPEKDKELAWLKTKYLNDSHWNTELHVAVHNKDEDKVKRLVEDGAYIDPTNKELITPLTHSGNSNDKAFSLRIIKYLIDNGANPFAMDVTNSTFFHNLVSNGPVLTPPQFQNITEYLLDNNLSSLFNMPGYLSGDFPLHAAIRRFEVWAPTLSLLKANGVNLNEVSEPQRNSIIAFALEGKRSLKSLTELTALGVDWSHVNKFGHNLVHLAAYLDHLEGVKYYCKLGLEVNAVDSAGLTPLHLVAFTGKANALAIVRALVENGADIKIRSKDGRTALNMALARHDMADKEEVIKLLRG